MEARRPQLSEEMERNPGWKGSQIQEAMGEQTEWINVKGKE